MSEANATPTPEATENVEANKKSAAEQLNDIQAKAEQATAEPTPAEEPEVILDPAEADISFDEILGSEEAAETNDAGEASDNVAGFDTEATASVENLPSREELQAQVNDLNDKLLRATAETENVRRRATREREEASKFAISRFAKEMLSVADNMKRVMDAAKIDDSPESISLETLQGQYDNLIAGLKISEGEMLKTFEQIGIKQIEAAGQLFDPNLHEALFEMPDPSVRAGTVMQVLEYGYTLNGRLLRPAKVGISKGGPREAIPTEGEPGSTLDQEF